MSQKFQVGQTVYITIAMPSLEKSYAATVTKVGSKFLQIDGPGARRINKKTLNVENSSWRVVGTAHTSVRDGLEYAARQQKWWEIYSYVLATKGNVPAGVDAIRLQDVLDYIKGDGCPYEFVTTSNTTPFTPWTGGQWTESPDALVEVQTQDSDECLVGYAWAFCWEHLRDGKDIVAYRFI